MGLEPTTLALGGPRATIAPTGQLFLSCDTISKISRICISNFKSILQLLECLGLPSFNDLHVFQVRFGEWFVCLFFVCSCSGVDWRSLRWMSQGVCDQVGAMYRRLLISLAYPIGIEQWYAGLPAREQRPWKLEETRIKHAM